MPEESSMMLTALGLGLVYAALPGVVSAEAIRRGISGGAHRTFFVYAGGLVGAAFWAALALTGTTFLEDRPAVAKGVSLIGIAFLLWLAWVATIGALRPPAEEHKQLPSRRGDIATGAVAGVANPAGMPFWAGIASGVVADQDAGSGSGRALLFVLGVLIGSFLWGCLLTLIIRWARHLLKPGFFHVINAVCAVAFVFFAIRMALDLFD